MTAPGVYIQSKQPAKQQGRIRTDIGGLLGYAERGPVNVAVAVNSMVEFNQVFGVKRLAYLADSAASFFSNGGEQLYVIRVAGKSVAASWVNLPLDDEQADYQPSFHCYAAAPSYLGPGSQTQMQAIAKYDAADVVGTERFYRLKSPGNWGDDLQLTLTLDNASQYTVEQWHSYSQVMRLSSVANIEVGSVLDIEQLLADDSDDNLWCRVIAVDIPRREVTLASDSRERIDEQKAGQLPLVYSVLLHQQLYYRQQMVEQWPKLGLHPDHSRYFVDVLNQSSLYIAFEPLQSVDDCAWLKSVEGDYAFDGGLYHLRQIAMDDFAYGIEQVALEQAITLLAAPDIVYRQMEQLHESPAVISDDTCRYPRFEPKGDLVAKVVNQVDGKPVARARAVIITSGIARYGHLTLERFSNGVGEVEVKGAPVGSATITIEADGFELEDFTVTITAAPFDAEAELAITPIEMPPSFSTEQILSLQQQLVAQADELRRYYLLLDVPATANRLQQVTDWRFQFDSRLTSLLYPWLQFDDLEQDREQPPSAMVMGALAKTDRKRGINYASANLPMVTQGQLQHQLTTFEHKTLNDAHVNCLVIKPGENIVLLGARTLSFARDYQYITTSRLILFVVQYLQQRMQWAAFEPNNHLLRIAIVTKLTGLLQQLWRKGALRGASPKQAFSLVCDSSNNTPASIDAGQLIADIGLAIVEPAEFIWLTYSRQDQQSDVRVSG